VCWSSSKRTSSSSHWKLTCSRHGIAEKIAELALNNMFKMCSHILFNFSCGITKYLDHHCLKWKSFYEINALNWIETSNNPSKKASLSSTLHSSHWRFCFVSGVLVFVSFAEKEQEISRSFICNYESKVSTFTRIYYVHV
jgi:predicted PolB exonuclease-like 3'-5' exonuclease